MTEFVLLIYRMGKKLNNWERLSTVIEWLNMTHNSFAMFIGMTRAEGLYHIKRGDYNISADMADRIVSYFPEINRAWLLSGIGNVLVTRRGSEHIVPYYDVNAELLLSSIDLCEVASLEHINIAGGCDIAARSSYSDIIEGKHVEYKLFMRYVYPVDIAPNMEYILVLEDKALSCMIHKFEDFTLTLETLSDSQSKTLSIDVANVVHAWLVVEKRQI